LERETNVTEWRNACRKARSSFLARVLGRPGAKVESSSRLMFNDLRTRLSELERKFNSDKITESDRGLLKNVDTMFRKLVPPQLLMSGLECCQPSSSPVRAARPEP
jgi:hypothetical protein